MRARGGGGTHRFQPEAKNGSSAGRRGSVYLTTWAALVAGDDGSETAVVLNYILGFGRTSLPKGWALHDGRKWHAPQNSVADPMQCESRFARDSETEPFIADLPVGRMMELMISGITRSLEEMTAASDVGARFPGTWRTKLGCGIAQCGVHRASQGQPCGGSPVSGEGQNIST